MHFFRLVFILILAIGVWACSGAPEGTDLPPAGQGGDPGQGGEPGTAGETPSPNSVLLVPYELSIRSNFNAESAIDTTQSLGEVA